MTKMKSGVVGTFLCMLVSACGAEPTTDPGATCGEGTHLEQGQCVPDTSSLTCGEGTHLEQNHCVPDAAAVTCGAGTHLEGSRCYPDSAGLQCGSGTIEQAGQCVGTLACGPGTSQQGTQCVPSSTISCGAGTKLDGSSCVAICGPGTHLGDNQCTADGWYEVRIGASSIAGDGYSKVPVMALGRLPDGRPATDSVELFLDRSTAGTLQNSSLTLAPLGANTYFTPCSASASNPLCAGPAKIKMVLASQPSVVVAETTPFTLVAPTGVGSTAPCDPYPRALFFDGSGYIFTGTQTVTDGSWSASVNSSTSPTHVGIHVDPSSSSQGLWWDADFAAPSGAGSLQPQVYPTAERYPFQPAGVAGLAVTGDGRGCNQSSGRFEIHKLTFSGGQLTEFVATFEQFCEKSPSNVLRGCVKYTR